MAETTQADSGVFENFTLGHSGAVATITLNRPEKLNSMTRTFWSEIRTALNALENDGQTRAVIITGAGTKAFSAGGDIVGFGELKGNGEKREFQVDAMAGFAAVENSPLPIIAAVNGWALGGGCELAIACDIVIAADSSKFGMPEVGIGLVPGFGAIRASNAVGPHWGSYLILSGEAIDARKAEQIGLVQQVVPAASLMDEAMQLAQKIASKAPLAVRAGKELLNRSTNRADVLYSVEALTNLQATADTAEGVLAFAERRPPVFQGR
jgi:enoyl-CoA hydratase